MKEIWGWVTHHKLPTVIVVCLIALFGLVLPWTGYTVQNNLRNKVGDLQDEKDNILDTVAFKLAFDSVIMETTPISATVGMAFQNTSDQLIEYRVKWFDVVLDNKTVADPTFQTTGGYAYPKRIAHFYYPAITNIDTTQALSGTLEYGIHYSSVPNNHWYRSIKKISFTYSPEGYISWHYLSESESQIDEP